MTDENKDLELSDEDTENIEGGAVVDAEVYVARKPGVREADAVVKAGRFKRFV